MKAQAKSAKPRAYQIGDRVQIVEPIFVERVGYPLIWTDLIEEFDNHPNLHEACKLLGLVNDGKETQLGTVTVKARENLHYRARQELVRGIAMAACRQRGFGGRERSLHTTVHESARDVIMEVTKKRIVKTGLYYAPYGHYSYDGEYDYEPGGLDNTKTHVLLHTGWGWIEQRNVKLHLRHDQEQGES